MDRTPHRSLLSATDRHWLARTLPGQRSIGRRKLRAAEPLEQRLPPAGADGVRGAPVGIIDGVIIAAPVVAAEQDDRARLLPALHRMREDQRADDIGARARAGAAADAFGEPVRAAHRAFVGHRDHMVDDVRQKGLPDAAAAKAFDDGGRCAGDLEVVRDEASEIGRALGVDDAEARRIIFRLDADMAPDRRRGAAGARARDDPRRRAEPERFELAKKLGGDIIGAAPVGDLGGAQELIHMIAAAALGDMFGGRMEVGTLRCTHDVAALGPDRVDLGLGGRLRHDRDERQPEPPRKPRLGNRGRARRAFDDQRVGVDRSARDSMDEQGARETVLEAAARQLALVLEQQMDAGKLGAGDADQRSRAALLLLLRQNIECPAAPAPCIGARAAHGRCAVGLRRGGDEAEVWGFGIAGRCRCGVGAGAGAVGDGARGGRGCAGRMRRRGSARAGAGPLGTVVVALGAALVAHTGSSSLFAAWALVARAGWRSFMGCRRRGAVAAYGPAAPQICGEGGAGRGRMVRPRKGRRAGGALPHCVRCFCWQGVGCGDRVPGSRRGRGSPVGSRRRCGADAGFGERVSAAAPAVSDCCARQKLRGGGALGAGSFMPDILVRRSRRRRYYGLVEDITSAAPGPYARTSLLLDCVDGDMFDRTGAADLDGGEGLALVRTQSTPRVWNERFDLGNLLPGDWVELELAPGPGGPFAWELSAQQDYRRGPRQVLRSIRRLGSGLGVGVPGVVPSTDPDPKLAWSLHAATENQRPRARPFDAAAFAARLAARDGEEVRFIVLDVGQASAILIKRGDKNIGLFDAGAPLWFNKGSVKLGFTPPDLSGGFIFLSHWDWDHYDMGRRHAPYHRLDWFAPDQAVGFNLARFQRSLGNRLHFVSGAFSAGPSFFFGRATGPAADRNASGYLLRYEKDGECVLLTGDADYSCIPTSFLNGVTALAVPHHGGASAPPPQASGLARAVVSYGDPNSYNHPHRGHIDALDAAQWTIERTAQYGVRMRGDRQLYPA